MCVLAEYAGYTLFQEKGAEIEFVAPPDGMPATPIFIGVVNKAPHPEAAKLFVDWALSKRGQAVYQNQKILLYGSVRNEIGPDADRQALSDFKLLFPTDWNDYVASHPVVREGVELDHGAVGTSRASLRGRGWSLSSSAAPPRSSSSIRSPT